MEIGKTYLINGQRKGTFAGRLERCDDTWATFTITGGRARAMPECNERELGEEVTVRRSLCVFTPMIEFYECANYRGSLQAKEEGGKFFWRVDCDVDEQPWSEIPAELWAALKQHHEDTAEQRKPDPEDADGNEDD